MEINNFKKPEKKSVVITMRITKNSKKFLDRYKFSPNRILNDTIEKLKEELKKETKEWN